MTAPASSTSVPPGAFRFRDALRDLARAPRASTFVIAAAIAIVAAPLLYTTVFASRAMAAAADGRAAFKIYELWLVRALVLAPLTARVAGALIASAMVESYERPLSITESCARTLVHGVPALLAAALALSLTGLGVVALVVAAGPLAAATFVAGPVAAVERRGPAAAMRRSARLTRGVRGRLIAWIALVGALELAPLLVARYAVYAATAKKPPIPPIHRAMEVHGAIVIAVAALGALVQVSVYRRLRGAEPAADQTSPPMPNPNVQ